MYELNGKIFCINHNCFYFIKFLIDRRGNFNYLPHPWSIMWKINDKTFIHDIRIKTLREKFELKFFVRKIFFQIFFFYICVGTLFIGLVIFLKYFQENFDFLKINTKSFIIETFFIIKKFAHALTFVYIKYLYDLLVVFFFLSNFAINIIKLNSLNFQSVSWNSRTKFFFLLYNILVVHFLIH